MKVKFSRCTSNNLSKVPFVDGQLIYTKDTMEVYLDIDDNRKQITDIIYVADITTVVTPIKNKIYCDTKTNKLYKADIVEGNVNWVDLSGASKEYVDTALANYVPLRSFPSGINITGTTPQFLDSIQAQSLPVGSMLLGLVKLTDMPNGLKQAEVQVEVFNNNVIYCTMKSADTKPYRWVCNSFNYVGWEEDGKPTAEIVTYDNTSSGMKATNVQNAINELNTSIGNINSILDSINGEVV